jgi:hypothetical protein
MTQIKARDELQPFGVYVERQAISLAREDRDVGAETRTTKLFSKPFFDFFWAVRH